MLAMKFYPQKVDIMRSMHMPADGKTAIVEILLVEDDRDDYDLMREALEEGCLNPQITWLDNGEDAVAYLQHKESFAVSRTPDLILLDLHLPLMNGHEVLEVIKTDALLRRIPIVIMTGTNSEEAIRKAYDLHANCCVSKPADREQFAAAVKKIENFWLRVSRRS
jgi:chemotaxis family two-component system response regulator Rcp1